MTTLVLTVLGLVGIGGNSGIFPLNQGFAQQQNSPEEEQNKGLVMAFFNDVYDNRNVSAIDEYVADNFTTSISADKESFKEITGAAFNSFPDLTRSLDHEIP